LKLGENLVKVETKNQIKLKVLTIESGEFFFIHRET